MTRAKTVKPKIVYKDQREFEHHLFKAEVATMLKNQSFRKGDPKIEPIEHVHMFHTVDSSGRTQIVTNAVGGHYHKIEWEIDDSGELVAKCSPPYTTKIKSVAGRQRKMEVAVEWEDELNNKMIKDTHVHEMTYQWSEKLSADTVRKRRNAAQAIAEEQNKLVTKAKQAGLTGGFEA